MQSTKMIRAAKWGYIVLSIVICALGILLLSRSIESIQLFSRLIGVILMIFGIIKLVGFYSRDLYRLAFQHDLALGILLIALGFVITLRPSWSVNVLCIVLGIETITDALLKLQTALDARRFGLNSWGLILGLAVAAGMIGIAMIICPMESIQTLVQLIGIALLAEGFLNLCVVLCAVKIISHQQSDVIEI